MNLEDMKYFVEVARAGSINQAAKTLFVAQPALSRRITAMEQELGFSLLERSKQGIVLTNIGKQVYEDCVKILQLYSSCIHQWQDMFLQEKNEHVVMHIVALPVICNSIMEQIFFEFLQEYPQIQLELHETTLWNILEQTVQYPHAIGIGRHSPQTKNEIYTFARKHHMQITPLFDDEYVFMASYNSPLSNKRITFDDFKSVAFASYSHLELSQFIRPDYDWQNCFQRIFYLNNTQSILNATLSNRAVSLFPLKLTQKYPAVKDGLIVPLQIDDFSCPTSFYAIASSTPTISEKIILDKLCTYYDFNTQQER